LLLVECGLHVVGIEELDADAWAEQLVPDLLHGLGQVWSWLATYRENVRVCRRLGRPPAALGHAPFQLGSDAPRTRRLDGEDVRASGGGSGENLVRIHRSAPSRQAHATATNSAARKRNISSTAVAPSWATTTAQGYMTRGT
jgi:hypothetical protein